MIGVVVVPFRLRCVRRRIHRRFGGDKRIQSGWRRFHCGGSRFQGALARPFTGLNGWRRCGLRDRVFDAGRRDQSDDAGLCIETDTIQGDRAERCGNGDRIAARALRRQPHLRCIGRKVRQRSGGAIAADQSAVACEGECGVIQSLDQGGQPFLQRKHAAGGLRRCDKNANAVAESETGACAGHQVARCCAKSAQAFEAQCAGWRQAPGELRHLAAVRIGGPDRFVRQRALVGNAEKFQPGGIGPQNPRAIARPDQRRGAAEGVSREFWVADGLQ